MIGSLDGVELVVFTIVAIIAGVAIGAVIVFATDEFGANAVVGGSLLIVGTAVILRHLWGRP
jgi:hypothetical protein